MKRQFLVAILLAALVSVSAFGQGHHKAATLSASRFPGFRSRSRQSYARRTTWRCEIRRWYNHGLATSKRAKNFAIDYATHCLRPIHPFNRFSKKRGLSGTATDSWCRVVKTNSRHRFQRVRTCPPRSHWRNRYCKHCRIWHADRKLLRPRCNSG